MKISFSIRDAVAQLISLLYVLLFVYASVAKLLDYQNFQVQLGQSPLLSVFAGWISVLVPVSELVLAIMLLLPQFRLKGLAGSYLLMVMFTSYIYIMLNHSSFVPCSCGGILEKLDWNDHLFFNIGFIALALAGIIVMPDYKTKPKMI